MRTRSRLLLGFVGVHLVLSLVVGLVAWAWIDSSLRAQAVASAASLGGVISQGGFPLTPEVMAKMRELTGYEFSVLPAAATPRAGAVRVPIEGGRVVEVVYQTADHQRATRWVVVATALVMLAGTAVFGVLAVGLSGQFARPVEVLAASARVIGGGDLQQPVPAVGGGEILALALDLEHMRQRIVELDGQHRQAERLATLGTFTATIAHEVRNPLSAVRLTVQMLAKRHPGDAGLTLIMEELERLDLIVDELLGFSKGMSVELRDCALRPLIDDVVRLFRRQAEHAGVAIEVDGEAAVRADPARLRQLLMNLLLNAIQAQHGGGAVRIAIRADGFAVIDRGPGVPDAVLAHLFQPFSSSRPGGTGLGLHLAWSIAQAHGARLSHERREPGCAFVLAGLGAADSRALVAASA